jgi:hypothetical protein
MRLPLAAAIALTLAVPRPGTAMTADELVAKNVEARGGAAKIAAL